jgi:hypothetical protein
MHAVLRQRGRADVRAVVAAVALELLRQLLAVRGVAEGRLDVGQGAGAGASARRR